MKLFISLIMVLVLIFLIPCQSYSAGQDEFLSAINNDSDRISKLKTFVEENQIVVDPNKVELLFLIGLTQAFFDSMVSLINNEGEPGMITALFAMSISSITYIDNILEMHFVIFDYQTNNWRVLSEKEIQEKFTPEIKKRGI